LAKKKSRKNRKHNSFVAAWDNTFSLSSSNTVYGYGDFCDSQDVNKIALDVFGALSASVLDLV